MLLVSRLQFREMGVCKLALIRTSLNQSSHFLRVFFIIKSNPEEVLGNTKAIRESKSTDLSYKNSIQLNVAPYQEFS